MKEPDVAKKPIPAPPYYPGGWGFPCGANGKDRGGA